MNSCSLNSKVQVGGGLSDFQEKVLGAFKAFDKFCKEHDIIYYAAYGTLLGAVRHKGFIPWDDDVDVVMIRDEYKKFLSVRDELNGTEYKISIVGDEGYPYSFAKFYSIKGTLQEYEQFRFKTGPWVDVFPMDPCEVEDPIYFAQIDNYNATHWAYRKAIAYNPIKDMMHELFHGHFMEFAIRLFKKVVYAPRKKSLLRKLEQITRDFEKLEGTHYRAIGDLRKNVTPRSCFDKVVELPFADMMIACPEDYDTFLKVCFGDYMQLPPVEKRVSVHNNFFMDLDNDYTFDEIEKDPRARKHPSMSIRILWDEIKHQKGF